MSERKRVAILGGGVGALSAAFALTNRVDADRRFEITVYQQGWRLGGKGASGRNVDPPSSAGGPAADPPENGLARRIEEHGLHVWGGFYDNAMRIMRDVLAVCETHAPDRTYRDFNDAFQAHDLFHTADFQNGSWVFEELQPPPNLAEPGRGAMLLSPREYIRMMGEASERLFREDKAADRPRTAEILETTTCSLLRPLVRRLAWLVTGLSPGGPHGVLARAVDELSGALRQQMLLPATQDPQRRELFVTLDFFMAAIGGMLRDGVLVHGFEAIDDEEFSAWLRRHGAHEITIRSGLVRGCYDYVFGFKHGAAAAGRRAVAAGTGLRGLLRLLFTYKGAVFWKMRGGMGDTIFTPLYLALRARGVRFRFFHRVRDLHLQPGADEPLIGAIDIDRQVDLADERDTYEPLLDVPTELPSGPIDLGCWPATPLYDQLKLPKGQESWEGIDLESHWNDTRSESFTLRRGEDFDDVVLGISIGALHDLTPELAKASPAWKAMLENVGTTQTEAMQLWFDRSVEELGWRRGSTIVTGFADPFDTWADMTHLLPAEAWPADDTPKSLAYFCAPLTEAPDEPPIGESPDTLRGSETERVRKRAKEWIETQLPILFPEMVRREDGSGAFDWSVLHDPKGRQGPERLKAQYFRANVNPSDRYVLSEPGTTRFRLPADGSGFKNLYLAGDWVHTPVNAGCVEAAAMAGLFAARGLSGDPLEIVGDWPHPPLERPVPARATTTEAIRAQNARFPWAVNSARLTTEAVAAVIEIPADKARTLLPPDLELAPTPLDWGTGKSGRAMHPLVLLFAHHTGVGARFLPFSTRYCECVLAVPYVSLNRSDAPATGPCAFMARLWLDRLFPTLLGIAAYGYAKEPARIVNTRQRYAVSGWRYSAPILEARFPPSEPGAPKARLAVPEDVRSLFEQPILSRHALAGWVTSFYDFNLEQTRVEPLRAELRFTEALRPALPSGILDVPPLDGVGDGHGVETSLGDDPVIARGAFRMRVQATLTSPMQSGALERLLPRAPTR